MTIKLSIRNVVLARERLIEYLRESGIGFESCYMRLHDGGLSLVVIAPTSQIPEEFHGVPVEVQDSV